jgi:hypothetical protein
MPTRLGRTNSFRSFSLLLHQLSCRLRLAHYPRARVEYYASGKHIIYQQDPELVNSRACDNRVSDTHRVPAFLAREPEFAGRGLVPRSG